MPSSPNTAYPDSVRRLMTLFGRLPGIGTRSAERIAFHILKSSPEDALALADSIRDVKQNVRHCSLCFNLTETDPCDICQNPNRDQGLVCIVEQPKDLLQLEATGVYQGVYHVLLGHIAPLDNITPDQLTIAHLIERVQKSHTQNEDPTAPPNAPIREAILATNPTMEGDGTALYLTQELTKLNIQITRLARGLPAGAQIEYANKAILADALTARTKV